MEIGLEALVCMGKITKSDVIVTGGAGFIGSHLVRELTSLDNRVNIVDIKGHPPADVRNKKKILALVKTLQPQYIFHLAAQAIVENAYNDPYETLETNIMGTVNVLEAAKYSRSLKCVLVTSSDKAYGKKSGKYRESDALRGDHPYEVSKSAADLISRSYYTTYGLPVVVTRFGNVYGEGDLNYSRIIPGIMLSLVQQKPLLLRSDGTYVRDYLYVKDVVRGSIQLAATIEKTKGEAFNFGSCETLSVIGLIKKIQKILHREIPYKILNSAKNEIPSQSLDFTKITKLISWTPLWSLEKSIPKIFEYYKKAAVPCA